MDSAIQVPTYVMQQRSERPDFYIRDKHACSAETGPHRHEYFQIQINLGGDTVQHIGGVVRPFPRNALAFILPHKLHLIPHPDDGNFLLINFAQTFLMPQLQVWLHQLPPQQRERLLPQERMRVPQPAHRPMRHLCRSRS